MTMTTYRCTVYADEAACVSIKEHHDIEVVRGENDVVALLETAQPDDECAAHEAFSEAFDNLSTDSLNCFCVDGNVSTWRLFTFRTLDSPKGCVKINVERLSS